ncbi:MAG: nucleotide exchange factor GrpE [Spirochaetales bacterium]|nr:nucleotide exchange factor GrpE [Spirochaetales bacterium]
MAKEAPEQEEIKDASPEGLEENVSSEVGEDDFCEVEDSMEEELNTLKDENGSLKDQLLRKTADFENYRKRMLREKQDTVKFGNQEILKDLIEVIDNFERALNASNDSKDFDSFYDGISMIEQQFTNMLSSKYNLTKMTDSGEEYDPNCHEALMMEENGDVTVPTVMEIYQTGYLLHDRVLRPAKVKVGKPAAEAAGDEENNSAADEAADA